MMPNYPDAFFEAVRRTQTESIVESSPEKAAMNLDCGCIVIADVGADEKGAITGCGYQTNGCPFMIAAAEAACTSINGCSLAEFGGKPAAVISAAIDSAIGRLPPGRKSCGGAVTEAFVKAFASLREKRIRESQSEILLVCSCFGVSEEAIVEYINRHPNATLSDLTRDCRAGSGCGSCRLILLEILESMNSEVR